MTTRVLSAAVGATAAVAVLLASAGAQQQASERAQVEQQARSDAQRVFKAAGVEPRRVMLLGTFHFKDAGLDSYKPKHQFDALSERRQKEISEVVERLAAFKPDRVCVEFPFVRQEELDKGFDAYVAGERADRPNEIYQIGMRLAQRMGHETVYAIDAQGRWYEPRVDVMAYAREHGQDGLLKSPLDGPVGEYLAERDRAIDADHLRQTFLYMNSEPMIAASHGIYLVNTFGVGEGDEYPGVDGFVSQWYNRNLKVFENIRRISEPGESVLVVIGAGHLPIIRHAAECSPEFKVIEVADYLAND